MIQIPNSYDCLYLYKLMTPYSIVKMDLNGHIISRH